ncbi:MAG: DUF3565 domain-containing protein [Candidatus Latescibacteria bacterium]|nr:DUF3565 domain-containing protein [Candidatus Latescibacterota bacterium]
MKQTIIGYHRDEREDWVAELSCGHGSHVRHEPPFADRPWVVTVAGRQSMLGFSLECLKCESSAYEVDAFRWQPISPSDVAKIMSGFGAPWWIAGGWAIDLFLGKHTRIHYDTDILVLRRDQNLLYEHLHDWQLHKAHSGTLTRIESGDFLEEIGDVWCRSGDDKPWAFQVMLMNTQSDNWVYKRCPEIRGPISEIGFQTADGIPYLKPAIQLLYKAKSETIEKDRHDFEHASAHLNSAERLWLMDGLRQQFGEGHEWIDYLEEIGDKSP